MALKLYKNEKTEEIKQALKPLGEGWVELISAPNTKYMEKVSEGSDKSRQKGMEPILKQRANLHSMQTSYDDSIQMSKAAGSSQANINLTFLNPTGTRRRKIDTI